ncbi:Metallo-dependent phosphatase-like protein [Xylariaceae sp. FL0804]|nr:Metallo-dependent phosphatase-like protein [Xylariaceae sp. FL0804]
MRSSVVVPLKWLPALAAGAMAAASYPPIPADLTTPVQQRIAIDGPNSVSIGWNTYEQLSPACVQYGLAADALTSQSCSNSSVTYPTSRTWSNAVTLSGLTAATTYYYQITTTNSSVPVETFLSPRAPGDTTPFGMSAVIDLGVYGADGYTLGGDESLLAWKRDVIPGVAPALNHTTIGRLADDADAYELVVHPGDFAYADDWYENPANLLDGTDAYEAILEQFFDQLAPVAGRKMYMASPGNHEADCEELAGALCPTGQKNFTDFMNRFGRTMPVAFTSTSDNATARVNANKAQLLSNPPFWYSFEYGMLHFTMINTETDFADAPDGPGTLLDSGPFGYPGQQLEFLEADLASVDRAVTPWLLVGGHRPWYTTGGSGDACDACQAAFEDTLYKYGVDLAIFGHVHNSQRQNPVYNNTIDPAGLDDPKAPMYIISGGAGNIEGLSSVGEVPEYNAFAYADDYAFATLTLHNATSLQVDFIRSATGETLDSSVLYKAHAERFVVQ